MVQVICASVATTLAAPEAEADPHYVAYGYVPALYNSYPNWPGVSTPYSSSTCFGCRGKRSADADADASALYGYYGYSPYAYGYYGLAPYGYGYPHATSYEARSPQGLGKRSADAEPEAEAEADAHYAYGYGYPSAYGYGYGYPSAYAYGYGYPRAYGYGYPYGYARW